MKKSRTGIIAIILVLIISGCATSAAAPTAAPAATMAPAAPGLRPSSESYDSSTGITNAAPNAAVNRLVVKNAELTIVVENPIDGLSTISDMAAKMDGYVVSSKSYTTRVESGAEVPQANITIRVPAEKLDEALTQIKKLVVNPTRDVRSQNVTGQDVTADYVDLQSRLTNLQNTQAGLQKIQDSATKTEDVLNVFNQLSQINQQIEQVKGQMKYYEDSAAMSAVSVILLAQAGIQPITIGGWEPVGVVRDAFQALINVGKGLVELLIWLVIFFVPIGLILFFPGRWIYRTIRKQMARKPASASYQPTAPGPGGGVPPQFPDLK